MADVVNRRRGPRAQPSPEPVTGPVMPAVGDLSTPELISRAAEQVSRLVRDELALAKAELARKGRHAGIAAGMFGSGGVLALYGVGVLVAAAVLGLAEVLPAWAAALVVAGVLLGLAGVLAALGGRQVRRAVPPVPQTTAASVRADVRTVASAVRRERSAQA